MRLLHGVLADAAREMAVSRHFNGSPHGELIPGSKRAFGIGATSRRGRKQKANQARAVSFGESRVSVIVLSGERVVFHPFLVVSFPPACALSIDPIALFSPRRKPCSGLCRRPPSLRRRACSQKSLHHRRRRAQVRSPWVRLLHSPLMARFRSQDIYLDFGAQGRYHTYC